jgi:hypothetical protein
MRKQRDIAEATFRKQATFILKRMDEAEHRLLQTGCNERLEVQMNE